ncbi:GDSL-lilke lipase/acylhydrolase family protein [Minicystis rosea]|nr:GDSL-lilke lipase/acylhydrolase family protein [Minicystis rosea]
MASHIALLGDSVFDNRVYTGGDPEVAAHLRDIVSPGWKVTLVAVDGSTTTDVGPQIDRVPKDATHVVLSLGGNDALLNADLLDLPVGSTGEALELFEERVDAFETSYGYVIEALVALGRKVTVCTIYNGNLGGVQARRARIALMTFNDAIFRTAIRAGVDVIDLRLVCTEPADFANPIEPSGSGGRKIATAVARAIGAAGEPARISRLTAG